MNPGKTILQRQEDLLLGRLSIKEGICTPEQVDECLKIQAQAREYSPLGDLLLFKGYLTAIQLTDLLARQHKRVMTCPACRLSFTVLTLTEGKSARCPRCKGPLGESKPGGPTRTDAEFSTQRVRTIPTPAGPKKKLVCVICDQGFEASMDLSGRARCPFCHSTFTPDKN